MEYAIVLDNKTPISKVQYCREALQFDLYQMMLADKAWNERLRFPRRRILLRTKISTGGEYKRKPDDSLASFRTALKKVASTLNKEVCANLGRDTSKISIKIETGKDSGGYDCWSVLSDLPGYFLHNPIFSSFWHGTVWHTYNHVRNTGEAISGKTLSSICGELREHYKDVGSMPLSGPDWQNNLKNFLASYKDKDFFSFFMKKISIDSKANVYGGGRFVNSPNGFISWNQKTNYHT